MLGTPQNQYRGPLTGPGFPSRGSNVIWNATVGLAGCAASAGCLKARYEYPQASNAWLLLSTH